MIITHIKKTYVIFICLKDVFGKNLPIYTFNNICEQDHSLTLGDEATKVIVNAEGSRDDLSENMRQTEAITQTEGNIRVASVPGSGKTFVLTYRIAYLITELFVEPSSIVALTFTNKAASQMKHRLWKIKNIHWVGLHLIRSRNMSGQKLNCRLFLRLNKNMILIIQRMPKMFWMP
ncbi:MAG: hypothetical protein BHW24_03010 [Lachnospira eligens]|nr:MAG: hypothetical protein BHW24_03010 [Lachnospira eligens]